MIRRIELTNLKTHADTAIDLGRLTVLVGPNGSGKSSVLMALHAMGRLASSGFGRAFGDLRDPGLLIRLGAEDLTISVVASTWKLALNLIGTAEWWEARVSHTLGETEPVSYDPKRVDFGNPAAIPLVVREAISPAVLLRLDGRALARPAPIRPDPRLADDGEGLAAVIAEMILSGADGFAALVEDARRVVPQVSGLRVRTVSAPSPDGKQAREGRMELLVDFDNARGVPAHAVSEGTLITIGLLTLLHTDPRPRLLLIDDLDHALHPRAQWELVAALRRVLELDPDLQIVATTHSADLVDELEADEVRVLALDASGVTRCRALSDHPRAGDLLRVLSTGELLSAEGEDWVIGADD